MPLPVLLVVVRDGSCNNIAAIVPPAAAQIKVRTPVTRSTVLLSCSESLTYGTTDLPKNIDTACVSLFAVLSTHRLLLCRTILDTPYRRYTRYTVSWVQTVGTYWRYGSGKSGIRDTSAGSAYGMSVLGFRIRGVFTRFVKHLYFAFSTDKGYAYLSMPAQRGASDAPRKR